MNLQPIVDINLFVHDGEATVGAAIESVLAQTWPGWRLTVLDDGSSDRTEEIAMVFARSDPRIAYRRFRCNGGAVAAFQRAFWHGDADFLMPKSGDDLLAPDYMAEVMEVLLRYQDTAMCHAAGLIFGDRANVRAFYPAEHNLHAVGPDRVERARLVMARYTSSPSFWGIYRRDAVDRLARIRYRAGWDHALLAELALYGEVRHVPKPLYWRHNGGKPILHLARAATERAGRGLAVDDSLTEPHWRTPIITTILAHLETFAVARVAPWECEILWRDAITILKRRWAPAIESEAAQLHAVAPALLVAATDMEPARAMWMRRELASLLAVADLLAPRAATAGSASGVMPPLVTAGAA